MFERSLSAGHLISWANRLFSRALDRRIKPIGISLGQVPVLLLLAEGGPMSQKEIVKRSVIEQPAMVAILKRMEANGLAVRSIDAGDARASIFALTDKAHAMLDSMAAALTEGNDDATRGFSDAEKAQLISLLHRVIANMMTDEEVLTRKANGRQNGQHGGELQAEL